MKRLNEHQYEVLSRSQGYMCAICGQRDNQRRKLCQDHDHFSGKTRGLLCVRCNLGLGYFHDDMDRLWSAINYLHINGYIPNSPSLNQRLIPIDMVIEYNI